LETRTNKWHRLLFIEQHGKKRSMQIQQGGNEHAHRTVWNMRNIANGQGKEYAWED
jgi:hypothetical protein